MSRLSLGLARLELNKEGYNHSKIEERRLKDAKGAGFRAVRRVAEEDSLVELRLDSRLVLRIL